MGPENINIRNIGEKKSEVFGRKNKVAGPTAKSLAPEYGSAGGTPVSPQLEEALVYSGVEHSVYEPLPLLEKMAVNKAALETFAVRPGGTVDTKANGKGDPPIVRLDSSIPPMELPAGVEAQRGAVRKVLDEIESLNTSTRGNQAIYDSSLRLEKAIQNGMDKAVANEVRARLAVHDSSILISEANGFITAGQSRPLHEKAAQLISWEHDIDKSRAVEVLLKDGLPGLKVKEAWNVLQIANDPREATDDDKTTTPFLTRDAGNIERKYDKMLTAIMGDVHGLGPEKIAEARKVAEKSYQLAYRLAVATFETSWWNQQAQKGNDQIAEIVHTSNYRLVESGKTREVGPLYHLFMIDAVGVTFLRTLFAKEMEPVNRTRFADIKEARVNGKDNWKGELKKIKDKKIKDKDTVWLPQVWEKPLLASDIPFNKLKTDSWQIYEVAALPKFMGVFDTLTDRRPDPKKYTDVATFVSLIKLFKETEKYGFDLREIAATGLVNMAKVHEIALGWGDNNNFPKLEKAITTPLEYVTDDGEVHRQPFLDEAAWGRVKKLAKLNILKEVLEDGARRGFEAGAFGVGRR